MEHHGDAAKTDINPSIRKPEELVFSGSFDGRRCGFENFLTREPGKKFSSRACSSLGKKANSAAARDGGFEIRSEKTIGSVTQS